jgi:hypothetical protein
MVHFQMADAFLRDYLEHGRPTPKATTVIAVDVDRMAI